MKINFLSKLPKLSALRKKANAPGAIEKLQLRKVFGFLGFLRPAWLLLSEVPGWPDAPKKLRLIRTLPVVLPCVALFGLAFWVYEVRLPRIQAERTVFQPVLDLDEEIASLRLTCSDQQATDVAEKAKVASQLLITEAELPGIIKSFKQLAAEQGWEASFQATDRSVETPPEGALISYLPVRGKMSAKAANGKAFSGLLTFLDQLSSSPKRIDLTRLAIRADEQGRYIVELNLRLACRIVAHEKTS